MTMVERGGGIGDQDVDFQVSTPYVHLEQKITEHKLKPCCKIIFQT